MTEQQNAQAELAREKANRVRVRRAEDKHRIKRSQLSPASIPRDPPRHWYSAKVVDLLIAMDRVGRVKAGRWCTLHGVGIAVTIRGLTLHQRTQLAKHVDVERQRYERARSMIEDVAA
jgi:hypothetical protein